MDPWGDHAFCCTVITKTTMHNDIRDGMIKLFKRVLTTCKLIVNPAQIEKELEGGPP